MVSGIILQDLGAIYNGFVQNKLSNTEPVPFSIYADEEKFSISLEK
jgi:hypothetical protein